MKSKAKQLLVFQVQELSFSLNAVPHCPAPSTQSSGVVKAEHFMNTDFTGVSNETEAANIPPGKKEGYRIQV